MPTLTRRAVPTLALAILAAAAADAPAQQRGSAPIIILPQVRPGLSIPQMVPQPPPANPPANQPASSPGVPGGIPWPLASPGASRLPGVPGVLANPAPPAAPAGKRGKPAEPFQMNAWWGFEPGARLGYIPVTPAAAVVVQPGVFVPGQSDPPKDD